VSEKRGAFMGTRRGMRIHVPRTPCYRRDEAVAAPGDRLDAALARLLWIKDRAKRRDLNEEVSLLDRHLGPDGGHDLFLRNDVAPSLDQHGEKVESARPDHDRRKDAKVAAPEQPAAGGVKAKVHE
jgi:hypothetical protein